MHTLSLHFYANRISDCFVPSFLKVQCPFGLWLIHSTVLQRRLALIPKRTFIITATSSRWLIIVKFCSVLYYQVRLDNGVSMHKLFAWFLWSTLILMFDSDSYVRLCSKLMFDWLKTNDPWVYYLTNDGLCTIWLHSNRNEEYFRSILIGSLDNVIFRGEHFGNVKAAVT